MNKLVIIGANEFQNKLIMKAKEMDIETHVFAWEKGAVGKSCSDYFYPISIVEKEEILKKAKAINPDGICSIGSDLAMPTVNYIANKLGLVCNSLHCTDITTNKYLMRNKLAENGLPCPKYYLVKKFDDLDINSLKFPLITKPIDRSGSRGIYKVNDVAELRECIEKSKKVSFGEEILVEEYIEGREFSVEFITQNKIHHFLQITEKFTTGEPNFIERGHLSPARLSDELRENIKGIVNKALTVLEVSNGASHSEVKVGLNGEIKIIEIAARMGGDYIGSDMVINSTGYDFVRNVINIALNRKIEKLESQKNLNCFVGFIFGKEDKARFNKLQAKYPNIILESHINNELGDITDSSNRNGHYILKLEENNVEDILGILEMRSNYDKF